MKDSTRTLVALWVVIAGGVFATPAQAYIDPGAGSLLVQGLIAAGLGVAFFFRNSWHSVVGFVQRLFGRSDDR